jgi:hypothetical protein
MLERESFMTVSAENSLMHLIGTLEEKEDGGAAVEAEGTTADLGSVVEEA